MRRWWRVAGIVTVVTVVAVLGLSAVAMAQDPEGEGAYPFNFGERFKEAVAGILGIEVDRYEAALDEAQEQVLGDAVTEGWLTQDQADRMRERAEAGPGPGMRGGFGHDWRGKAGPADPVIAVAAEKLGLTVQELRDRLGEDVSIADVAAEEGVTVQEIIDAHISQLTETLDEAVSEGRITQNQADWMIEQAAERAEQQLNGTPGDCVPGFFRGGRRPGRMWGFPGQGEDTGTSS